MYRYKFRYRLIIFFLLGTGLFLSNCNKFEDGNNFSIRSTKWRLIDGSPWYFEKLEVDGIDKSNEFRADSAFVEQMNFNKVHRRETDVFSLETISDFCYSSGDFKVVKHNKIQIYLIENGGCNPYYEFSYYDYGPIFLYEWIEWEITKLTKRELHMKTIYYGKEYKLMLNNHRP